MITYLSETYREQSTGAEVLVDLKGVIKIIGDEKIVETLIPVQPENDSIPIAGLEDRVEVKCAKKIVGIENER